MQGEMDRVHAKYPYWGKPSFEFAHFEEDGGLIGALGNIKLNLIG